MERRHAILLSAAASPGGQGRRCWTPPQAEPRRASLGGAGVCPLDMGWRVSAGAQHGEPELPTRGSLAFALQRHLSPPSAPLSNNNSGYWDSAPDCFMLFLFHPPAIISCCSSETTAKLCCSFFFFPSPSLISFLGQRASQITLHPLTHMHAHTLYRKCLLMRGQ